MKAIKLSVALQMVLRAGVAKRQCCCMPVLLSAGVAACQWHAATTEVERRPLVKQRPERSVDYTSGTDRGKAKTRSCKHGGRLQGVSHIKARLGRSAVWLLLLF